MPISSFFGLETTLRGLLAQQRALDVTGHNVANANTEGYSRQQAVMAASAPMVLPAGAIQNGGRADLGSGVDVLQYRRIRDTFLDLQFRAQSTVLGDRSATTRSLDQAELALSEPGDNGLSTQLNQFWSAWADLSNAPENAAARQSLVDTGRTLAATFATLDTQLQTVGAQAASEYASLTGASGDVQGFAAEIASLNTEIKSSVAAGGQPNDLMDRRDQLLDKLSALATVSVTDLGNGSIDVRFGDAATPLVADTTVTWPQALTAPQGKLGALLRISQPGGTIASYRADLEGVATTLATAVNGIHGTPPFFSYTPGSAASTLAVNVTAATITPSTSGAPGANDIALAVSGLRGGATDSSYTAFVTRIGSDVRNARREETNAGVLVNAVDDRRQSTSGVSMDEEMSNLIRFQRGYQASSRALSTMDDMLDTLINRTGRVGL